MKKITEPVREIPTIFEKDVVVVGGGPAGILAAIAAARCGAETLLVERYGFLGGTATAGLMTCINGFRNQSPPNQLQAVKGIPQEMMDEMIRHGGATGKIGESPYCVPIDPEVFKYVALKMTKEAGVSLLLHSYTVGAICEVGLIKAIIGENKSGRQAIAGKVFVDATGDGDVAAFSGVPFEKGRKEDGAMMSPQLMFRMAGIDVDKLTRHVAEHPDEYGSSYDISPPDKIAEMHQQRLSLAVGGFRKILKEKLGRDMSLSCIIANNVATFWGGSAGARDGLNAQDMTEAELIAREETMKLAEAMRSAPGFESACLVETAVQMGVRETRRIVGEYMLTSQEALDGARFDDVVAISANPMAALGAGRPHFKHEGFDIPYRCLVPQKVDNLLLAGRCISVDNHVIGSTRAISSCMATGQAAGTAAALCAKEGVAPRNLDVSKLQEVLLQQNVELRR